MTEEETSAVIKEIHDCVYEQGYKDAIDECIELIRYEYSECTYIIHRLKKLKEQK